MKNTEHYSYLYFLKNEFEGRKLKNPTYSLRAYARDLGISAPKLSEILRGKCGLSEESAKNLASKLKLTKQEEKIFINHVNAKHARSKKTRQLAEEALLALRANNSFDTLALDAFKIISDWQHFAILELTELSEFSPNIAWIARRLGLSKETIKESIDRLFDTGLLAEKKGTWYQTEEILATPSGIPSSEIKKHHLQILSKASDALINCPINERDFSSTTLAVSESQLLEIQQEIKDFRRKLASKINQTNIKDRVYCLSIQFFPVDIKEIK